LTGKNRIHSQLAAGSLAAAILFALPALAQETVPAEKEQKKIEKPETQSSGDRPAIDVEGGVPTYGLSGELPGKFEEHRDVQKGAQLRHLDVSTISGSSPRWLMLRSTELGESDQRVTLELGRTGLWRTSLLFDDIPHFFSNSPTLFQNTSPGFLSVSPQTRAHLQSLVDAEIPENVKAALFDAVRSELAAAPVATVATQRRTGMLQQSYRATDMLELHAQASRLRVGGTQPIGVGTFARYNVLTPPTNVPCGARTPDIACDGEWESLGNELPAPLHSQTFAANAGAQLAGKTWTAGADYDFSRYHPSFNAITYENPFRITDAQATPPGSSTGRNRMVLQQWAVPPTSTDHRISLHGSVDLPMHTQFQGLFSWGETTQNDDFLPYTLNTALSVQRVGGSVNLPADFNPRDSAFLPRRSLNGRINTQNHDYSLLSRPVRKMTFRVQYRAENQDNRTPTIVFPGMSRFGESDWVTSNDYYGNALQNTPRSFLRADAIADWRWDVLPKLTVGADYDRQTWHRDFRDVPRTKENAYRLRLDARPAPAVTVSGSFLYGHRTADTYKTIPFSFNAATNTWEIVRNADNSPDYHFVPGVSLEPPMLRRYDEADRIRRDGRGAVNFQIGAMTALSLSTGYRRDDYLAGDVLNFSPGAAGLNFERAWRFGGELTVSPSEQKHFFASYSNEQSRMQMLGVGSLIFGAVNDVTACCVLYPIANTWIRRGHNTLSSVVAGGNFVTQDEKTTFDLSYGFTTSTDRVHSFNPFPVPANAPRTATAYDYPDVINRLHEAVFSVMRNLRHDVQAGVEYRHESYHIDDFYLNDMSTYPEGAIVRGGIPSLIPRQMFLNARYGSYSANQAVVFLRYHVAIKR